MLLVLGILVLLAACAKSKKDSDQLPLGIKGHGIMDLHKGDTALVLSYLASFGDLATGNSMLLTGGDMGDIYPGDSQNLTAFYPNLYLVDRVGYCELEIAVPDGEKLLHTVSFNTTVPRAGGSNVPSFLREFSSPGELKTCRSPDLDPARSCQPVLCDIKYNGVRNFFNETSQRCEPTASCWDNEGEEMVYLAGSNACRRMGEVLSDEELEFFDSFQEPKAPLRSMHGYPIIVNCHKGRPDPAGSWCLCDPGWESDPLDHDGFNPDFMVYHMCTVYSGVTTATPDNSSASTHHRHRHTKKTFLANIPKKRRRGEGMTFSSQLERGAKLMAPGKGRAPAWHFLAGGTAAAPSADGGSKPSEEDVLWYGAYVSDAQMRTIVLPVLIATVTLLSCLVLALCVIVAVECQKAHVASMAASL